MNRKLLCLLPLSWIAMACVPVQPRSCDAYKGPLTPCTGDPLAPQVTINTITLNATPHCVRAKKGTFVIFRLVPHDKNELGTVEIFPKNDADTWLAGENDPYKDLIIVSVPADLEESDHDYGIATGSKCVDPRIHVEN